MVKMDKLILVFLLFTGIGKIDMIQLFNKRKIYFLFLLVSPSNCQNAKETSPAEPKFAKLVKLGGCGGLEWTLCAAEIFGLHS